jgi:3-oxoacyl-[acyl-carrier protein] reductase
MTDTESSILATSTTRLQGRAAIVSGGAGGIGQTIVEVFAREGANVLVADLEEPGTELGREPVHSHGRIESTQADVADATSVAELVRSAIERFGRLDILCHAAGISRPDPLEEMSETVWDRVLDTNLKSAFLLFKECVPAMRAGGWGRVVFISSITGPITGIQGYAHYGASKAGMLGLVRTAALEVAQDNITVNAVLPGNILTPVVAGLGPGYIEQQVARIPMGRLGSPEDVANAMLFLASAEASYITGQTLIVDGGQTLPEA